jgi:tetratricopeptide (TPR) repeat protein
MHPVPLSAGRSRGAPAWLPGLAAVLLALGVYAGALRNGYALDDVPVLQQNPAVQGLDLRALLTGAYWPGSRELYRPLTLLSFAVERAALGDRPGLFHATNALLHALATGLLFALLRRLGAGAGAAGTGAALFAVHPVHAEAVANLVGRSELLAASLVLLASLLFLSRAPAAVRVAGAGLLYLLALASKEIAVSLPALLLVMALLEGKREGRPWRDAVRAWLPTAAACAVALGGYLALRASALGSGTGSRAAPYLADLSPADRLATAARLVPEVLRLLAWPADLSSEWGPGALDVATWAHPLAWAGVGIAVLLAAAAWSDARRGEGWAAAAVAWAALAYLPVSQAAFPIGTMLAERTLYLPSAALAFLAPAAAAALRRHPARLRPALAALALLLALGAWRTAARVPVWRSTGTVRAALIEEHPEVWRVAWDAAGAYEQNGEPDEADRWFRKAVALTHANEYALNVDYARFLLRHGRAARADSLLARSMAREPSGSDAPLLRVAALLELDRPREALALAVPALARPGLAAPARRALAHRAALAYDRVGRTDSAMVLNTVSLRGETGPARYARWLHRARLLALGGDPVAARAAADSARFPLPAGTDGAAVADLPRPGDPALGGWGGSATPASLPAASASPSPLARP